MADLSARVGGLGISQIMGLGFLFATLSEVLRVVAGTVTVILGDTGQIAFNASPDQATILNRTARVWDATPSIVATQDLGTPAPDGNGVIVVNLAATFAGLPAGTYTVSILATDAGGSTDSAKSASFSLPLDGGVNVRELLHVKDGPLSAALA